MKTQNQIKEYINHVVDANRFAVLATSNDNQPLASLVAITAIDDLQQLFFATYRNTRKCNNLIINKNVSILFENRNDTNNGKQEITVLTAFGKADEVDAVDCKAILETHVLRHPELETFLHSTDCVFFLVKVNAYQIVLGVDDILWWNIVE